MVGLDKRYIYQIISDFFYARMDACSKSSLEGGNTRKASFPDFLSYNLIPCPIKTCLLEKNTRDRIIRCVPDYLQSPPQIRPIRTIQWHNL